MKFLNKKLVIKIKHKKLKITIIIIVIILLGIEISSKIMEINYEKSLLGGLTIPKSAIYKEKIDTHGGFHGDGDYFAKIKVPKDDFNTLYKKASKSKEWKSLPIENKIAIPLLYGGDYNNISYGTLGNGKKIPKNIKHGLYYYKNKYKEMYPDDKDNYDIPFNYIVSVLDKDNNLIYVYEFDS